MKPSYQIVDVKDSRGYAKYLAKNGGSAKFMGERACHSERSKNLVFSKA